MNEIPTLLEDIATYHIRNSDELVAWPNPSFSFPKVAALKRHLARLPELHEEAVEKHSMPASEVEVDDLNKWVDDRKGGVKVIETDCRDAKRRVSLIKAPPKNKGKRCEGVEEHVQSGEEDLGSGHE